MGYRLGSEVIAFNIIANNVQINTLGQVAYLRMELALLGISNPNTNVELAESRVCQKTKLCPKKYWSTLLTMFNISSLVTRRTLLHLLLSMRGTLTAAQAL